MTFDGNSEQCAICLQDFGNGDNLIRLECSHMFHHDCWRNNRDAPAGLVVDRELGIPLRDKCAICRRICNARPQCRWIYHTDAVEQGHVGEHELPVLTHIVYDTNAIEPGVPLRPEPAINRSYTSIPGDWTSSTNQASTTGASASASQVAAPETQRYTGTEPPVVAPERAPQARTISDEAVPVKAPPEAPAWYTPLQPAAPERPPLNRNISNEAVPSKSPPTAPPLWIAARPKPPPPPLRSLGRQRSNSDDSHQAIVGTGGRIAVEPPRPSQFSDQPSGSGEQLPYRDPLILRIEASEGIFDPVLGYTPGQYPRETPEGSPRYTTEPSPEPYPASSGSQGADASFTGVIVGDSEWGCETYLGLKPGQEAVAEKWRQNLRNLPGWKPKVTGCKINETALSNGKIALIIDIGSYGNLAGDRWLGDLSKVFVDCGRSVTDIEQIRRAKALSVSGVGSGSQVCNYNTHIPIAIPTSEGTMGATLKVPTVPDSDLPGLLGLQSLRSARSIIDTETNQLFMLGPGDYDLMSALPPGTSVIQLEEAPSGHLMMPCDQYNQFDIEQKNGGLVLDKQVSLPVQTASSSSPMQVKRPHHE